MRSFQSLGWYHVNGMGDCVSVINDQEFQKESNHLIGERVLIDGVPFTVKAVEAHAVATIRSGVPIGLLIYETRQEPQSDAFIESAVRVHGALSESQEKHFESDAASKPD